MSQRIYSAIYNGTVRLESHLFHNYVVASDNDV